MSFPMARAEYECLEAQARAFCELRAEYHRRKRAGTLGRELESRMVQDLNALDLCIERLKSPNELERRRALRAITRTKHRAKVRAPGFPARIAQ